VSLKCFNYNYDPLLLLLLIATRLLMHFPVLVLALLAAIMRHATAPALLVTLANDMTGAARIETTLGTVSGPFVAFPLVSQVLHKRLGILDTRVTATGEKRKRGYAKGTPRPATYGSGQRVQRIRSLHQVCERTALPPPKGVAALPLAERRMLEQSGTLEFVQAIQHEKLKIRQVKKEGTRSE